MSMESDAKRTAVLRMLNGFPSSTRLTEAQLEAYHGAVAVYSLDAVRETCRLFADGRVAGHDNAFIPTVAQLSAKAREIDDVSSSIITHHELERIVVYKIGEKPPDGMVSLGEYEETRRRHADLARDQRGKIGKSDA